LKGDRDGDRECHVGGDFLLIYRFDDSGKYGLVVLPEQQHIPNCSTDTGL
jgi:mRNA-degrading endonuclease YafQ of YafQ-DinJ toxin-antitoxin module